MGELLSSPRRRVASGGDRLAMAALGAAALYGWFHLPELVAGLPWRAAETGLGRQLAALGPQLSGVLEWAGLTGALLGFQIALARFEHSRLHLTRPVLGTVAALLLSAGLASLIVGLNVRAVFVPVALGGLWVSASFGLGAGLVTVLMSLALCAMAGAPGVLAAPLLVRAVALILFFKNGKSASDGPRAGLAAGLLSAAVAVSISLGSGQSPRQLLLLAAWMLAGGLLEGTLYLFTRGLGERLLGHVSRERLVALLDLSQPLLQRMVHRAPGSFEHSRAMANLAEQAASSIGADALLTRVGAYYHDLGKSVHPKFFVENLGQGESSAHEGLSPEESAAHILRHVTDGVKILREAGIPEAVVEFSYTHHGSQRVEYFLNKQRKLTPDTVCEEKFRYPGMKPGTKETGILMLVDSIEAASRTIDSPERERLEDMVRRIVFSKLAAGQLDDANLSLAELRVVCQRVVETLVHMNHHRIKYPWQEERARQFGIGERELSPKMDLAAKYPLALKTGS